MTLVEDFRLLEKHGFKLIPYEIAQSEEETIKAAEKLKYPVAIKIISPEIEHKSDSGGVKVDLRSEEALKVAYREMIQRNASKKIDGVLVQKMARKGMELIIGGKKDAQFGHMLVLGLGGIYVEIFKDVSARICPVETKDVEEMIAELKSHPLLEGARGKKPINKKELEKLVVRASQFMQREDIKEMDLNPVICDERGCDIIDARFRK
ncbi:acetate--CoA ligase family protein [Candidatus Micrarchaeota archaeon]|nr:acetate--CoA ligase family protein [Candidatus Micrarchaeota archaeon]